jgi:histidinol-phosphatase (PHP family)
MIPDYHIHTYLCHHAEGKPQDYTQVALKKGITEICIADHAPAPDGYDPKHRMSIEEFDYYTKMVTELKNTNHSITVLYGIEADYYDGCEQFLREWLPRQNFDLIIGSVHYIDTWGFDSTEARAVWETVNVPETWARYFAILQKLAATGLYDIVGHIDIPKKFNYRVDEKWLEINVTPVLEQIASSNMAIEINTSGLRKPVHEIYPSLYLLKMCKQYDIPICFGSDAHAPTEVGWAFDEAVTLARTAGYTHYVRFKQREKILTPLPL